MSHLEEESGLTGAHRQTFDSKEYATWSYVILPSPSLDEQAGAFGPNAKGQLRPLFYFKAPQENSGNTYKPGFFQQEAHQTQTPGITQTFARWIWNKPNVDAPPPPDFGVGGRYWDYSGFDVQEYWPDFVPPGGGGGGDAGRGDVGAGPNAPRSEQIAKPFSAAGNFQGIRRRNISIAFPHGPENFTEQSGIAGAPADFLERPQEIDLVEPDPREIDTPGQQDRGSPAV